MSKFDSGCPIAPKLAYRINLWENNSNTGTECLLFTQDFDKFCTGVLEVIDTYSLTPQQCSIKVNPYGVFFSCCIKKSENTPVFEDWSYYSDHKYDHLLPFNFSTPTEFERNLKAACESGSFLFVFLGFCWTFVGQSVLSS